MKNNYISLHNHSDYSFLDSVAKIPDLVAKAKNLGMPSLAITDHGNICGWLKFYEACKKEGIKPIFGVEAYIVDDAKLISRIGSRIEYLEAYQEEDDKSGESGPLFEHYRMEKLGIDIAKVNEDLFDENNNFDAPNKIQKLEEMKKQNARSNHVILLAKNKKGYQNILKISSEGWLEGMYYKPRIDLKILEKYKEGIIVCSACLAGQIPSSIMNGEAEKAEEYVREYKRIFGEDFYIELQLHEIKEQKEVNLNLIELINKYKVQPVIAQDVHYVNKEDIEIHETVIKLRRKQKDDTVSPLAENGSERIVKITDDPIQDTVAKVSDDGDDESYFYTTRELYFKSYDELKESWKKYHPDVPEEIFNRAIENTDIINNKVEKINVRSDKPQIPTYDTGDLTPRQFILKLIKEGAAKKLTSKVAKKPELKEVYEERMKHELNTICELNFEQYFLIVWEIMNWCKENDVMTGIGRGSAAGSLIAYLLGITGIDPIQHDLLFSRFINKSRSGAKFLIEIQDMPLKDFEKEKCSKSGS